MLPGSGPPSLWPLLDVPAQCSESTRVLLPMEWDSNLGLLLLQEPCPNYLAYLRLHCLICKTGRWLSLYLVMCCDDKIRWGDTKHLAQYVAQSGCPVNMRFFSLLTTTLCSPSLTQRPPNGWAWHRPIKWMCNTRCASVEMYWTGSQHRISMSSDLRLAICEVGKSLNALGPPFLTSKLGQGCLFCLPCTAIQVNETRYGKSSCDFYGTKCQ